MKVNGAVSVGQGSEMPIEELEQINESFADQDDDIGRAANGKADYAGVCARIQDHLAHTPS